MMDERISDKLTYPSKYVEVYGANIHYIEAGHGDPILFLHGMPASSYLWRNVMPHLVGLGRCIAPDLIGMGRSDKPDIAYTVADHINYIEQFIKALNLKNITLVMHAWGSVIGFDYAMRHENNCKGLVFFEAFLHALDGDTSLPYQEEWLSLHDEAAINELIANGADFVSRAISQNVIRQLTDIEIEEYRRPFAKAGSSKPLLQYLKELPKGDGKSDVDKLIAAYTDKLTKSSIPKLMLYSIPGLITTIATVMWAKEHLPNLEVVEIGEELHFAQESHPMLMGESISIWLQSIEQMR